MKILKKKDDKLKKDIKKQAKQITKEIKKIEILACDKHNIREDCEKAKCRWFPAMFGAKERCGSLKKVETIKRTKTFM